MSAGLPEVLQLRMREATVVEPELGAFARRSPPAITREAAIAVMSGDRPLDPDAPILVFFQQASFGIPAPTASLVRPDLGSWCFRPTAFGYLASVSRGAPNRRARAAWVIAACLPLAFAGEVPAANAAPSVQRPKTVVAPPALPDAPPEPVDDPTATTEPPADAVEPPPPEVVEAPTAEPSPPPVTNTAIVDAAWEGVDGFDVELTLKGGKKMRGRVGAVQQDTFTLIQAETGAVLVLPKSGVLSLFVRVAPPIPRQTGAGGLIGGGILTGVGTPVFISGVAMLAVCPSCAYIHLPLLLIGAATLGAGIPLLVRGAKRRQAYRKAVDQHLVAPMVSRTPGGWSGGVRFRF